MKMYTIVGEQSILCERKINEILAKHKIEAADMISYDMRESTIQSALFDLQTIPFLCAKKAILVKNPEFLTGKEIKNDAHDLNAFISFLENPVADNILIVYAPYEKLDERKKIVKLLKKQSEIIKFEPYTEASLKQWAKNKLTEKSIEFNDQAIDLLLKLTQAKMDNLYQEIEKLEIYFLDEGKRLLTTEIVELLVPRQLEDNVFLLTDALSKHKIQEAYKIYQDLLTQNEEPFKLLILIGNQFRLMKQVIQLGRQGYSEADISKMLGVHPYRVKLMRSQSYGFDVRIIEEYIYQIAQIDYKIKSGVLQKDLAIELLILNLKAS